MTKILEGPTFSTHKIPKKLIIMLHGYGDNAENFINLAQPFDKEEWGAYYLAINAPTSIPNYPLGYQWFELYPNGTYISKAGPNEINIIRKEVKNSVLQIESTIKHYLKKLKLKTLLIDIDWNLEPLSRVVNNIFSTCSIYFIMFFIFGLRIGVLVLIKVIG